MNKSSTHTVQYRCVCGADVEVDLTKGGICEQCQRDVSPNMLRSNVSMTIDLPTDGSIPPAMQTASSQVPNDELIGKTLGHFKILSALGHGGMGSVYRALDESLQRFVALKVIETASPATNMDQLMQEARAQARVNHPHVVHIYYVSPDGDPPFLAMELVDGPTLAQRLRGEPLPYAQVVRIAMETTKALSQSARFDIVHGDIKPSNILLEDETHVKLSDFGLSSRISRSKETAQKISGTPAYMAPEICQGQEATVFSDQYSLGVMLFQMTFGRQPYTVAEESVTAMMGAHQHATVEFPKPWPQHLPEQWKHILKRLLAKQATDRFESYEELQTALVQARPLNLPKAQPFIRGMAWLFDFMLLALFAALLSAPVEILDPDDFVPTLAIASLIFAAPLTAAWLLSRYRTTPAKKFMQIRVVDEHGLSPSRSTLAARSVFQNFIIWVLCFAKVFDAIDWTPTALSVVGITVTAIYHAICAILAVFQKQGKTLHDRLLGTRVCLDAGDVNAAN